MKSIRKKIFLCCIITVGAALLILGVFAGIMTYKTSVDSVKNNMSVSAGLAAERAGWEIKAYEKTRSYSNYTDE